MAEGEGEKIRARAHLLETLRLRLRRGEEREERDDLRGEALGGVAVFAKTCVDQKTHINMHMKVQQKMERRRTSRYL